MMHVNRLEIIDDDVFGAEITKDLGDDPIGKKSLDEFDPLFSIGERAFEGAELAVAKDLLKGHVNRFFPLFLRLQEINSTDELIDQSEFKIHQMLFIVHERPHRVV